MKLWNNLLISILTGLLVIGCSSPEYVQMDDTVNLNNCHTYIWVDTKANENDNSTRATAYADLSVKNAVNAELHKLGWREVSDNPDAFVSYDILVERSKEQRSEPVYSQPFTRMYYNPFARRWSTIYYPSQFIGYQNYEVCTRHSYRVKRCIGSSHYRFCSFRACTICKRKRKEGIHFCC